jgi:two-component system, cell cycle response regulator DivK
LILMDIQLPGMDGLQATALLKADEGTKDIPVIALTALAMKGDEERILAAGCDGYVAKPLAYKDFLAVVAATLSKVSG